MVSEQEATEEASSPKENNTPSPGKLLRERRESLGLSQQQIATKIFLKAEQINNLEEDNLGGSASITFTKGYVRNYAKQLGLNAEELVATFEQYHNNVEQPSATLQSFSRRVAKQTHDDRWMMVTYIILLLIAGGVVTWWYQQPSDERAVDIPLLDRMKKEASSTPVANVNDEEALDDAQSLRSAPEAENSVLDTRSAPEAEIPILDTRSASDTISATEDDTVRDDAVMPQVSSPQPLSESLSQSSQTMEDDNEGAETVVDETNNITALMSESGQPDLRLEDTPEPALPVSTSSDTAEIDMTFTFIKDCWVSIKDATGETIAFGVKKSGRIMEIQGVPPVAVTLGAPDNVRISVNGDPVDIPAFQNGQIARFSLPM